MPIRQKPFAETGAASSFKQQIETYSNGFTDLPGVTHLGEVTPFQRQVLDAASAYEAEQKEAKREEMRQEAQQGQGGGRPMNSRSGGVGPSGGGGSSGLGSSETVRYINKQEKPDHPVHDE